jgi:hypothetical protein
MLTNCYGFSLNFWQIYLAHFSGCHSMCLYSELFLGPVVLYCICILGPVTLCPVCKPIGRVFLFSLRGNRAELPVRVPCASRLSAGVYCEEL